MIRQIVTVIGVSLLVALYGCEPGATLAEVEFGNSTFGLEYVPDRSLEGYNEKYHPFFQQSESSARKYLLKADDGFMFYTFPKDPFLLSGIEMIVVDTIARTYEKYDRTVANTTLYVDPKLVDRSAWQTLTRFVKESYSKPDSANQLLLWLNHGYNVGGRTDTLFVFNTIYALVYTDVDALEPVYARADGKRSVKVGVDNGIYFKDETEPSPTWLYSGKLNGGVFYYWGGRRELVDEFGEYERAGVKFASLYTSAQEEN